MGFLAIHVLAASISFLSFETDEKIALRFDEENSLTAAQEVRDLQRRIQRERARREQRQRREGRGKK